LQDLLCSLVTSRLSDSTGCTEIKQLMARHRNDVDSFSWWSYIWATDARN
jgi:hypothetical protein